MQLNSIEFTHKKISSTMWKEYRIQTEAKNITKKIQGMQSKANQGKEYKKKLFY